VLPWAGDCRQPLMQGTLSSSVETGVGSAAMEASFVVIVGCMGRFCTYLPVDDHHGDAAYHHR